MPSVKTTTAGQRLRDLLAQGVPAKGEVTARFSELQRLGTMNPDAVIEIPVKATDAVTAEEWDREFDDDGNPGEWRRSYSYTIDRFQFNRSTDVELIEPGVLYFSEVSDLEDEVTTRLRIDLNKLAEILEVPMLGMTAPAPLNIELPKP